MVPISILVGLLAAGLLFVGWRCRLHRNPDRRPKVWATLRQWVQAHPVVAFPLFYIGWAYLWWTPILLSDASVWALPNLAWFLIGGASPLLAGLGLAVLTGGSDQLRDIAGRLVGIRRIALRWWFIVLLFWLVFDVLMAVLVESLGLVATPLDVNWSLFTQPFTLGFLLLLSFVFPAVEELGLRGYYLPTLQAHYSSLVSGLINGLVWAAWHTPFLWMPGYYANTTFQPELWWWLPSIVCHTLLIVMVYNRTHGSLLAVVIFHGLMNFTGEALGLAPALFPYLLLGSAVVVAGAWRALGRADRECAY